MSEAHDFPPLSVDTFIKRKISYNPFHSILQLINAKNIATDDALQCALFGKVMEGMSPHLLTNDL